MKKSIYSLAALLGLVLLCSAIQADQTLTRSNGSTFINTSSIGKKIRGFKSLTPVRIEIKGDKVVKVEALPNQETPQYFNQAARLLRQYEGLTVKKAQRLKVDGVSGATYSSEALKQNVQLGLDYYRKNAK